MRYAPGAPPPGLPLPLPDEVPRARLLDRIEARWHHPVTVVLAGAGCGKSTLVAQAMRANALAPRGIDVWHSCGPGDVDADVLGAALLRALHASGRHPDLATQIADTLAAYSPIDVCLVLDDAHEVRAGSSGADLVRRLVRALPANAHLVLAARHAPPGALSRLRAADRVLEITQDDLLFTDEEAALVATRLGRSPDAASSLGGWPALVRLALAARPDVAFDYAGEEVLVGLSQTERRALYALSHLGYVAREVVAEVVGVDVDLERLAATVPLISRTDDGRFRAHDLWSEALARTIDRDESTQLRARVIERLVASDDLARAGAIALAHGDLDALAAVALVMVSRTVSVLPIDTVRPWSAALRRARPDAPETRLLHAAIAQAIDFTDAAHDGDVDAAADAFRARDDVQAEITALAVGTVSAHARGEHGRLIALAQRAASIPGGNDHPVIGFATHAIAAVVAEMSGDPERAVAELRRADLHRVPPDIATSANRFLLHCLLLTGRGAEAAELTDRLMAASFNTMARSMRAYVRWMAGDPNELLAMGGPSVHEPGINSRDEFVRRSLVAFVLACVGRRDDLRTLVEQNEDRRHQATNTRDAVLVTVGRALRAVLDHDDAAAAQVIDALVEEHRASPVLDQHLRRYLSVAYVVHPELRRAWDGAALGPSQVTARSISRLLVELRAGHRAAPCDLEPAQVFTTLPLPWSIELACRLHADGHAVGARLAAWLVDRVADAGRAELRHQTLAVEDRRAARVARAANDLLAHLPAVPARHLEISVLGPVRITFGGVDVGAAAPGLRRARVRTLLALLVVHGSLSRERVIDLLWPELDAPSGARNLRVTLTYLRQLLEPERPTGEASFHLRADAATIALQPSEHLTVDLWELRRGVRDAVACRERGDADGAIAALDRATSSWRGDPLIDLAAVIEHESEVEHARLAYLGAVLELGELRLARGRAAEASIDAERALVVDPYSERSHRLAIAAALHGPDGRRTAAVAGRAVARLEELGVAPEPGTQILLRQAAGQPMAPTSANASTLGRGLRSRSNKPHGTDVPVRVS